ncbi:MAG: ParB/RepB/Spo0J family partition protein [Desulfobulbaceae bacterium]|nr:MAG: ParB/RepB/Spo0J family partition protein [Desulfobulbaceae bacterium]
MVAKSTGLGQGVGALFGDTEDQEKYFECDVEKIAPNKHQPRVIFDEKELDELSQSIKENGVIQPLIVSAVGKGNYELVAGERRLRASKRAGLKKVPVVITDVDSEDSLLEIALIENIQRTDLNALEEAEAYKKLIDRFGYTQEETAKRVGKKRSTITNTLRLLLLPDQIKDDLANSTLSEGHARAFLKISEDPSLTNEIREQVVGKNLSVRQTEQLIRNLTRQPTTAKTERSAHHQVEEIPKSYRKALENQLTNKFNSRVVITQSGSRGKIEIEYYSLDDLDRLVSVVISE